MIGEKFLLGINYWPRHKAMYWWKDFSETEVEEEFNEITSLNLSYVRIFLLWEDFQPKANQIYGRALKNLEMVMEIAESLGLKIILTLFVGHMTSVNWIPSWALSGSRKSSFRTICGEMIVDKGIGYLYGDRQLLEVQMRFIRTVVPKLIKYPSLFGWDIGNEVTNLLLPRSPGDLDFWISTLSSEIKKLDPVHPLTMGLHQQDLEEDRYIRLKDIPSLDFLSMHGYSIYSKWIENPLDYHVPPFLSFLAQRLWNKRVLLQEFGVPTKKDSGWVEFPRGNSVEKVYVASEEEGKSYYTNVLNLSYKSGVLGEFIWSFSDYDEKLRDIPPFDLSPHELYFGITRSDGSLKPMGETLRDFGAEKKDIQRPPEHVFDIDEREYFTDPRHNLLSLFKRYKECTEEL